MDSTSAFWQARIEAGRVRILQGELAKQRLELHKYRSENEWLRRRLLEVLDEKALRQDA